MTWKKVRAFTLAEILTVVAVIGVLVVVVIPALSAVELKKLDVAAEEVANALRFAIKEADRTGGYILVDGQTVPGHLRVVNADASGVELGAVNDPLTKTALNIDVAGSAFSQGIGLAVRFFQGGTAYAQLLVGPGAQMKVFDGATIRGPLEAGSGVVVSLNSTSVTVALNEVTGRVTLP